MAYDTLADCRAEIDRIDANLVSLFCERMEVVRRIGEIKQASGKPVYDPVREAEKLNAVASAAGDEYAAEAKELFTLLMRLSRSRQVSGRVG